jgi:hypothetical protein
MIVADPEVRDREGVFFPGASLLLMTQSHWLTKNESEAPMVFTGNSTCF